MRSDKAPEVHPDHETALAILGRVKAFLWDNALHVAVVVGLLVLGSMSYKLLKQKQKNRLQNDWAAVWEPQPDPQEAIRQCRQILQSGSERSAFPFVMLRLGGELASSGEWSEAAQTYEQLLERYPQSVATEMARPAYGAALEELGRYEQAAGIYENLAKDMGAADNFFDAARCRELAGQAGAAKELYEHCLQEAGSGYLADLAKARLGALARGELLKPPPKPEKKEEPPRQAEEHEARAETAAETSAAQAPGPDSAQ